MKANLLVYGAIAAVIAVPGFFIAKDLLSAPSVGDCARPTGEMEMDETDCASPEATYRLVKEETKRSSCPEGDYFVQTTQRARKTGGKTRHCYVLNVKVGDCLKRANAFHERVMCGTGGSQRVSRVTNGVDRSLCGDNEIRTYSEPATTICLEKS